MQYVKNEIKILSIDGKINSYIPKSYNRPVKIAAGPDQLLMIV